MTMTGHTQVCWYHWGLHTFRTETAANLALLFCPQSIRFSPLWLLTDTLQGYRYVDKEALQNAMCRRIRHEYLLLFDSGRRLKTIMKKELTFSHGVLNFYEIITCLT